MLAERDQAVLYLGDLEPEGPGEQIEANTRRVLAREAARVLDWQRVAITESQVAERGIGPVEKLDRRFKPARPYEAWETEALGQVAVMALVREALDALLPEPLARVREREAAQRRAVADFLGTWNGA
jgi:hypothetical protein